MKRIFAVLTALVLICSCSADYDSGYYDDNYYETNDVVLTARNFSSDATVWYIPDKPHADPLSDEMSEWQKISLFEIDAHSSYSIRFDSKDNYVTPIETYGMGDTLTLYIFKKDVWDSHSWQELVHDGLWSCKARYSVADAISAKGIITYPIQ